MRIGGGLFGSITFVPVCDENHDGNLDPSREVVSPQERDQFLAQNDRRSDILNARAANRLQDEQTNALVDIIQFMANDLALHVTGAENLTLRDAVGARGLPGAGRRHHRGRHGRAA